MYNILTTENVTEMMRKPAFFCVLEDKMQKLGGQEGILPPLLRVKNAPPWTLNPPPT